tara:strand:- start:710 stop:1249 length:540 start_codon:yes stop_codon:yes gene_type:complete
MKFFELKSYYIVTDIKEHKQIKQKLLDLINLMPNSSFKSISKTDWNLPKEHKREYLNYFYGMLSPYLNEMCEKLKCTTCSIDNGWFQVYNKNDKHEWHTHPKTNYTNVYYLNLPNKSIRTNVYDLMSNKIIDDLEVNEGQLLTLPANFIHRSPSNNTNDKKIIISFNSNFDEVDLNKVG